MVEYCCAFGHVFWSPSGISRCRTAGCPAPSKRTGQKRGNLLDDHRAVEAFLVAVGGAELWECWVWKGHVSCGLPQIVVKLEGDGMLGVARTSARLAVYEFAIGKMPKGMVPKPACGVEMCVNPFHLRARAGSVKRLSDQRKRAERKRITRP